MSHDHNVHSSGSSMDDDMGMDMDTNTTSTMHGSDDFCKSGTGTVMLNGFQAASKASSACVLFLFEGSAVNTETKYAFAIIGVFLMGFVNEMVRYGRDLLAKDALPFSPRLSGFGKDVFKTGAFAVQMVLAYFLMLLVMLYEYVFLIFIILGLSVGHLVTLRLAASRRAVAVSRGEKTPPEVVGSSGTPCCNNDTCA